MNAMPCSPQKSAQPFEEPGRRDDESALALDRLDEHAGDVLLADLLMHLVDRVRQRLLGAALGAARPAVGVRHREAVDLRRERCEPLLVRHDLRGQRHGHLRSTVERVVEADDRLAAGGVARDLHAVLHGLGAGVGEERLLREIAGRERVQPLGEFDRWLVPGDPRGVDVSFDLPDRCLDHVGRRVPDVQHGDAGREVDQPVAVDVLDDGA